MEYTVSFLLENLPETNSKIGLNLEIDEKLWDDTETILEAFKKAHESVMEELRRVLSEGEDE